MQLYLKPWSVLTNGARSGRPRAKDSALYGLESIIAYKETKLYEKILLIL